MDLIEVLTKKLGVQEDQAKGGAGLLFQLAKQNLAERDFFALAHHVPGISDMLNAAPQTGARPRVLGGLGSVIVGESLILPDLASLTGGFSKLGLDSTTAYKFVELVLSYVQSRGGARVRNLFEKALL